MAGHPFLVHQRFSFETLDAIVSIIVGSFTCSIWRASPSTSLTSVPKSFRLLSVFKEKDMLESVSACFRTTLRNSSKQKSSFSNRNLTLQYVNHSLLLSVVPTLTSFSVSSHQCSPFRPCHGKTAKLQTLTSESHEDEIFEKQDILHI